MTFLCKLVFLNESALLMSLDPQTIKVILAFIFFFSDNLIFSLDFLFFFIILYL